jgi:hypothetical protein
VIVNTRKTSVGAVAGLCAVLAQAPKAAAEGALDSTGANATALAAAKSQEPEGTAVTFTGFHVESDGTSRLTVELAGPVPVEATVNGTKAEYLLVGASIPLRNNKNPLITKHFASLVTSARLVPEYEGGAKPKGKRGKHKDKGKLVGVRVVVEMREPAKPEHRVHKGPGGTATLVVDFPKPKKAPEPEPDEQAPAPPPSK